MRSLVSAVLTMAIMTVSVSASEFVGTWSGIYECDGVERRMTIVLKDSFDSSVSGSFSFLASGAHAEFVVSGIVEPDGEKIAVIPGEWISQPPGYDPVGFVGFKDRDIMFGAMSSPSCGSFYARKIETP